MKTVSEHIEHIKGKPHHIRKRVAFTAATGVTTLIALVWVIGSLSFNRFAIQGSNFADSTGEAGVITTDSPANTSGLAGVAAASGSQGAPAHIEIVDTTPPSTTTKVEQTILPF